MGAGWIRGSPCSGDELHLVTVDKLLVGWVIVQHQFCAKMTVST